MAQVSEVTQSDSSSQGRFYTHKLNNGLLILAYQMPDVESVAVSYHVVTGTRDEDPDVVGISHFLEHMVFKGTQRRDAAEISLAFNNMGAEFNAFTSHEMTVYYARVLSEYLENAVELLSDMMQPKLDATEFTMERNVILEEIARMEDMPSSLAFRKLLENYFGVHPLGRDVLGPRESIKEMRVEQMRDYWRRRYSADNMILAVAGKFKWDELVKLAERYCNSWPTGTPGRQSADYRPLPMVEVYQKESLKQEHIMIAFPSASMQDKDFYPAQLAGMILGDGNGSRLFWNIYQKGLAETAGASFNPYDGTGMMVMYANASPEQAPGVLKLMRAEVESLERDGIHEDELQRAKDKLISNTVIDGESSFSRMRDLTYSWLTTGTLKTIQEEVADIEKVTVEDVHRVLKRFPMSEALVVTAMGPLAKEQFD